MRPGSFLLKVCMPAFRQYPSFVRRLIKQTRVNPEFVKTGMLYVARSSAEEKVLNSRYSWQRKMIPMRRLSRELMLKSQPDLCSSVMSGLFYPTIAKINPKKLRQALLKRARQLGVDFHIYKDSASLLVKEKKVAGVRITGEILTSSFVVNAAGAWAGQITSLGKRPPVIPVRGQILILKGKLRISTIVHSLDGAYIVPWGGSKYLVGSTVEFAGFNPKVTLRGLEGIKTRAENVLPAVGKLKKVTTWAGLRPFSKDHLPFVGQTSIKGYYWATGYYRSGILIGTYVGELLAKGILSGHMPSLLKPFHPGRIAYYRKGNP
jgi:glycine oxidase